MSTKHTLRLITLILLVNGSLVAVAAQARPRQPNANERVFQEAVRARTGPEVYADPFTDHFKPIRKLLIKNIRLEIKSDALARAAAFGDVELLQLLIKHGADVNYVNEPGQTVLMLAATIGFFALCGNDSNIASYRGNAAEVKSLLAAGARLDDRDPDGNTALMLAAQNARSDSVKLLLDAGADVNLKNGHGRSALICAASSSGSYEEANLKEIVKALIAAGADLNERDEQCLTARAYAVRSPVIAAMLIFAGAIE
jgi:ankyrin repeat protein